MTATQRHRRLPAEPLRSLEARKRKAAKTILLISAYALPLPRAPSRVHSPHAVVDDTATKHDADDATPTDHT